MRQPSVTLVTTSRRSLLEHLSNGGHIPDTNLWQRSNSTSKDKSVEDGVGHRHGVVGGVSQDGVHVRVPRPKNRRHHGLHRWMRGWHGCPTSKGRRYVGVESRCVVGREHRVPPCHHVVQPRVPARNRMGSGVQQQCRDVGVGCWHRRRKQRHQ
jgi:hypothetical protein